MLQRTSCVDVPHTLEAGTGEPSPRTSPGEPVPSGSHPLSRVHRIVEQACADHRAASKPAAMALVDGGERLIRAALLQSMYSFACNEQLMEQLRYNALYRWFVGLRNGEATWNAADYGQALDVLRGSQDAGVLFRDILTQAHAYAALQPGRFRIDAALVEAWTRAPAAANGCECGGATGVMNNNRGIDELCMARLERARAVILRRIGDPGLDPDLVASELCMSRRALYLMFEKHGLTPTRAIREIRLEACRRLLADARHRHRKITDIAMDFGFEDAGSFSRQFKIRYGLSPSEARVDRRLAGDGAEFTDRYRALRRELSAAS